MGESHFGIKKFLNMIRFIEKKIGFTFANFILQDPFLSNDFSQLHFVSLKNFEAPGFFKVTHKTPVIFLNNGPKEIFQKFNKTTRNEINKTMESTELFFENNSSNFNGFYELYKNFEATKKRLTSIPSLDNLLKNSRLFLAYYKKEVISAVLCYDNGEVLRANIICSKRLSEGDKEFFKLISNSSRRLIFEICKYGIENGYSMVDLGEVCIDQNDKKFKIAQYKLNFTQELIDSIHYYRINNPILKLLAWLKGVNYF